MPYPVHRSSWSQMGQLSASWMAAQAAQSQAIMGIASRRYMANILLLAHCNANRVRSLAFCKSVTVLRRKLL